MEMLISLTVVIIYNVNIYQNITLYTLKVYITFLTYTLIKVREKEKTKTPINHTFKSQIICQAKFMGFFGRVTGLLMTAGALIHGYFL